METNWPDTVPILSARDICKGGFNAGHWPNYTYCLTGWAREAQLTVNPLAYKPSPRVWKALKQSVSEVGLPPTVDVVRNYTDLFNVNDRIPKPLAARVWNRAMAILGYTVGNPERKRLPRVFGKRTKSPSR
jgi:hypothetical protein